MNSSSFRIVFAILLILHGLMTMSLSTVPVPAPGALRTPYFPSWRRADVDSHWPASKLGLNPAVVRTTGWLLWLAATILFTAAGLGLLGVPGLASIWQALAVIGAVVSLILLALFWHLWLILGVLINIFILVGSYTHWFTRWFSQ